jgi:hypothetical protein
VNFSELYGDYEENSMVGCMVTIKSTVSGLHGDYEEYSLAGCMVTMKSIV